MNNNDSAANRLVSTISQLGRDTVSTLCYGTVTKLTPLTVTREDGIEIPESFLALTRLCKPFGTLWEGLEMGETVMLISLNGNQRFLVERL